MRLNRERLDMLLLSAVRVLVGLLWLQNVGWKRPPDFPNVARLVQLGIEHPTLPLFSDLLSSVIEPNIEAFGWAVLIIELVLAVTLLFGIVTRFAAALGAVTSLSIGLTVASAPNEWGWSYWLMVAVHVALYASPAAGRIGGLDGALRQRWPSSSRLGGIYHRWAS